MIYQLGVFSDVGFYIEQAIRSFFGWIASELYQFIIYLYNIFMILSRTEILKNSTYVQMIYRRVGMILGLFMIFKLSFSLIQSLVEPEKLTDKKNGFANIIIRCVISIVLLGITPSLFSAAFRLQNIIVGTNDTSNVIYKLIIPNDEVINTNDFGRVLAVDLYFCFFTETNKGELDEGYVYESKDLDGEFVTLEHYDYDTIKQKLSDGSIKSFSNMNYYLTMRVNGHYVISWNFLFSPIVAIIIIYLLVTYCIAVATRVFQLAYLQLIAPVPILSYISDPEGAFKKWTQQCLTTFLDLFIRLAIIYFVITLSSLVLEIMNDEKTLLASTGLSFNDSEYIWVKIFLLIGLLMFGKRVPDLLKDLFPNMGSAASLGFGGIKLKDIPGANLAKGAATFGLGAAVGGIAGVATGIKHGEGFKGKLAGAFGGLGRGMGSARTKGNILKNAGNGINSTRLARQRAYEKNHDGSTFWGRKFGAGGAARTADEINREESFNKNALTAWDAIDKELSKNQDVQAAQAAYDNLLQTGMKYDAASGKMVAAQAADYQIFKDRVKNQKKLVLENAITTGFTGNDALKAACDRFNNVGEQGKKQNYGGFNSFVSINDTSASAKDRASAFFDTEKNVKAENADINTPGGKKYEEKRKAEANAKYKKGGK